MLTPHTIRRINQCLSRKETFALVLMPGSEEPVWFGVEGDSAGAPHDTCLEISPWLGRFDRRITIGKGDSPNTFPEMEVESHTTTREEYFGGVKEVIGNCRLRKGKTVYSRVICDSVPSDAISRWGEIADELFTRFPHTFRYILYTPATQGWMGATPEILADYTSATSTMRTVALAGTRPRPTRPCPWDEKNLRENRFVSDYITQHLRQLGLSPSTGPLHSVAYGNIEHLCAEITCEAPASLLGPIIDSLNPTPALCGYPLADAISDIRRYERHRRHLYGGFIAIRHPGGYSAFVNLRCVHFSDTRYCIYGGGGIVESSDPADEYAETEAKTSVLRQLLGHRSVLLSYR